MFTQIINRFLRAPLQALGVVLLAAALSGTLCALNAANAAEQARYEQTLRDVKVELTVTNLSGTRNTDLDAPVWVTNVFTSKAPDNTLRELVEQVQYAAVYDCKFVQIQDETLESYRLMGLINYDDPEPLGTVTYFDGWNSADMLGREMYAIIPQSCLPADFDPSIPLQIEVTCSTVVPGPVPVEIFTYRTLTVIGTHTTGSTIAVPYKVARGVFSDFGLVTTHDFVNAKLKDSGTIELVREMSKTWFAEPHPTGEKTPWDYSYYFYYPYALKIDDSLLVNAERTLKISLLINELCAVLVFALSAGASFFVGFLMIRSRKREIALMRTLGTPAPSVFMNFALEQLLCLAVGTAIGGGIFGFEPPERLIAFAAVYFTGLCLALVIFLGKNLMATLKEDE